MLSVVTILKKIIFSIVMGPFRQWQAVSAKCDHFCILIIVSASSLVSGCFH